MAIGSNAWSSAYASLARHRAICVQDLTWEVITGMCHHVRGNLSREPLGRVCSEFHAACRISWKFDLGNALLPLTWLCVQLTPVGTSGCSSNALHRHSALGRLWGNSCARSDLGRLGSASKS
eukprot:scaffold21387_cov17-Tisochrysis_lutea.AAC.2